MFSNLLCCFERLVKQTFLMKTELKPCPLNGGIHTINKLNAISKPLFIIFEFHIHDEQSFEPLIKYTIWLNTIQIVFYDRFHWLHRQEKAVFIFCFMHYFYFPKKFLKFAFTRNRMEFSNETYIFYAFSWCLSVFRIWWILYLEKFFHKFDVKSEKL